MKIRPGPAIVAFLLTYACLGAIADEQTAAPGSVGSYRTRITGRSRQSLLVEMTRRLGWNDQQVRRSDTDADYELENESFEMVVPESYRPDRGWGLLVWTSPSPAGHCPAAWKPMLEARKLIWISPLNAGNGRSMWRRLGLAIDAAEDMRLRMKLDGKRVYVAGLSGGGRIASLAAVAYPDIFAGGLFICGVSHYRQLEAPGTGGKVWRRAYNAPPPDLLRRARTSSRLIFLTGENDPNREQTAVYFKDFKAQGFQHVTYIEVPGMGHSLPPDGTMEQALDALDGKAAKAR